MTNKKIKNTIVNVVHEELDDAIISNDVDYAEELSDYADDYTSLQVYEGVSNGKDRMSLLGIIDEAKKIQ